MNQATLQPTDSRPPHEAVALERTRHCKDGGEDPPGGSPKAKDGQSDLTATGLTLRLVLIVLILIGAGLYAYEYELLPADVSIFVALAGIYPLTYLAYLGFAAKAHRKRLEDDFRLLGLAREEQLAETVASLYQTVYSPVQFVVYIGLAILISLVVFWSYLRCVAGTNQCLPMMDAQTAQLVFFSYLGAYVFSVQELVRRYNTFDLQPQVYSSAVVRMLIAIAIVFVGASIIRLSGNSRVKNKPEIFLKTMSCDLGTN